MVLADVTPLKGNELTNPKAALAAGDSVAKRCQVVRRARLADLERNQSPVDFRHDARAIAVVAQPEPEALLLRGKRPKPRVRPLCRLSKSLTHMQTKTPARLR